MGFVAAVPTLDAISVGETVSPGIPVEYAGVGTFCCTRGVFQFARIISQGWLVHGDIIGALSRVPLAECKFLGQAGFSMQQALRQVQGAVAQTATVKRASM